MSPYDDILGDLQTVSELPLSHWQERFPGYRPLGFMNAYVPEELFHAAGFTPVLLLHRREERGQAKAHLPGFTCWVVRSALDQALAGDLAGLAGVAFAHTCDAVQALADLWPVAVPQLPAFYVAMPHHLTAPAARPYLLAELRRLRKQLEQMTGQPLGDDALRQSIALSNRTRALLERLYEATDRLPAPALHAALRAAFLMPREVYNPRLAELLDALPTTGQGGPRLIIVGPELADPTLYQVIAEAGGRVVDDLLDLGRRHVARPVAETGDPLEALADHALALLPTPTKYHPQRRRDAHLLDMVRARQADLSACVHAQADGVIFARQKFCEPHGFDYVTLKAALDRAGVPHLLVELEQTPHVGQMRTRVEAFLEIIGA